MWRGYHKLGSTSAFEELARIPSTLPVSSDSGPMTIKDQNGNELFALVLDDLDGIDTICTRLKQEVESPEAFQDALLNTGQGQQEQGVSNNEVRQSKRCIIESAKIAGEIWDCIQAYIPPPDLVPGSRYKNEGWCAVGVNPCLRILKYDHSDFFEVHKDGSYYREMPILLDDHKESSEMMEQHKSFLTLQIYLNDGGGHSFVGGATRFFTEKQRIISASTRDRSNS